MRIALLLAAVPIAAAAQDPGRALGPSVNAHYTQASSSEANDATILIATSGGGGGGLTLGYAFSRWVAIAMTADLTAGQSVTDLSGSEIGTQSLSQTEVTARFQYPLQGGSVTPYLSVGYSSRLLNGPLNGGLYGTGDFSEWGGAFAYGGGVEVFIARQFALEAAFVESHGSYARLEAPNGAGVSLNSAATASSRFMIGGTWHLGSMVAPPLAPSDDTISAGQRVRLKVGGANLVGTVIGIRRDTVILQQMVHDTARQADVPRGCIAGAERSVPVTSRTAVITRSAFVGAIVVSLVGVVISSTQTHAPSQTPSSFVKYGLGGAVLGGLVGAISGEHDAQWQSLHLNPAGLTGSGDQEAACHAWRPPA